MPVTAKLSKTFYDRLGDRVADELVDWFNQVDDTYRSELRALNDRNFARFESKLDARINELRSELRSEIHVGIASLRAEFAHQALIQTRWMVGMWGLILISVLGLWIRR